MNYINILDEEVILKVNINYDFNLEEGRNGDDIDFFLYKDGSGVNVNDILQSKSLEWSGNIVVKSYFQEVTISEEVVDFLINGATYSLIAIDENDNIVYRGKVHTTKQSLSNYSINKRNYKQKTNTNDYTILD